jgi:hypothetical protein
MAFMPDLTVLRAALAALLFAAAPAQASPFAVQLGDIRIALDTPPGFSDAAATGSPRVLELAQSLTSASNRILLFGITDADFRRFSVGDPPEMRRYLIAVTPSAHERYRVSQRDFERYVADVTRGLGTPPADTDYRKRLKAAPEGQPLVLAELVHEPALISFMQGARLAPIEDQHIWSPEKPDRYLLSTTTLLLLRHRALSLSIYTGYDSPQDLDWLTYTTKRWVEDLKRINPR